MNVHIKSHERNPDDSGSKIRSIAVYFFAMAAVLAGCGWLIAGVNGAVLSVLMVVPVMMFVPKVPSKVLMRLQRAVPMDPWLGQSIYSLAADLAGRAGLPHSPRMYWYPAPHIAAFSVGTGEDAAVAVSDGALRRLSPAEFKGVLAHEIAHIAHGDTKMMMWAAAIHSLTGAVSMFGLLLILFVYLMGGASVPIWMPFLFAAAPWAVLLVQRALSRDREFAADADAVALTGEAYGLRGALQTIVSEERWSLGRLLGAPMRGSLGSLMATHPDTRERIVRLGQELERVGNPTPTRLKGRIRIPVLRVGHRHKTGTIRMPIHH